MESHITVGIEVVGERTVGHRTIAGTRHPIVDQLVCHRMPGKRPQWRIVVALCNGTPDYGDSFTNEAAARRAWAARATVGAS